MQRLPNSPIQFQFGVRGWAAIAVGLTILAAIAILAIGFLVFVLPVLLLGSILFWFLPKPKLYRVGSPSEKLSAKNADTVEGDFKVTDGGSDDNLKPPSTHGP